MRLRNLLTFVKVARLQSFHAAARQLHASQPAISARINALEDELGVQLFVRDTSGTRLTPRGVQLLPYAEKLVAISQEMKMQLQEDTPVQGSLRIGVVDTVAHLWLTTLLQHWREQFPLMEFEIAVDVSSVLWRQLQDHQLDLALLVAENHSPQLITEPLCSYGQTWVAKPGLCDQVTDLPSLLSTPILSFPRHTQPWQYLQQLFEGWRTEANGLEEEIRPMLHTCSSVESLLALAEQGVGVALLPEPLVTASVEAGKLRRIAFPEANGSDITTRLQAPPLAFCCAWHLDDDRILPRLLAESCRQIVH